MHAGERRGFGVRMTGDNRPNEKNQKGWASVVGMDEANDRYVKMTDRTGDRMWWAAEEGVEMRSKQLHFYRVRLVSNSVVYEDVVGRNLFFFFLVTTVMMSTASQLDGN